jgi:prolyl 4-hydroxylase
LSIVVDVDPNGRSFHLPLFFYKRYFANIFIHFEPTGNHVYHRIDDPVEELDNDLPPYIIEGSPEESNWRWSNPNGWKMQTPSAAQVDTPEGHIAALSGDTERLASIAKKDARLLHHKDRNGWQPIHEAARAGHMEAVAFLVQEGADMNARTHNGKGNTPLNIAIGHLSEKHPVSQYLISLGALDVGPDL